MPSTVDRCATLARDVRAALDLTTNEGVAIAVLLDGLLQVARQGMGAPVIEAVIAHAARELRVPVEPWEPAL